MRSYINTVHFKRYKKFIQSRTAQIARGTYVENHHIIPESVFPNNVTIALTAREHYIAHKLLTKVFKKNTGPWFSMAKAFGAMFWTSEERDKHRTHVTSRDYEYMKKLQSEPMRFKNPMHDPEVSKRASKNMKKSWTPERRAAQAERARNQAPLSDEAKKKLSDMWIGVPKPKTEEQVKKIVKASAVGLFITPWGEFDSPGQASRAEGNTERLSRHLINKYCKDPDNSLYSFISYGKVETRGLWKRQK